MPGGAPDRIRVRLEVDKVRYHSGDADEVLVKGRGAETAVSLVDTAYYGEVTSATPPISFGDVDVVISGRSVDRATTQPLPNTRLKLILNQEGFERVVSVTTDSTGLFTYRLTPGVTDGGLYRVAAVHPEITDRPDQRSFVINRVRLTPLARVSVPPNYPFAINLQAVAGPGTSASNLRLVFNAASQPTGQLPEGVSFALPAPINIVARQTLNVPVTFTADSRALRTGVALLDVIADGSVTPIGQVRIEYVLTEARPILVATPNVVNTGMAQGGIEIESLVLENRGILPVTELRTSLTLPDNSPAPAWVTLVTPADIGTLAVGEKRTIEMNFAPPSGTSEGIYRFLLKVEGSAAPASSAPRTSRRGRGRRARTPGRSVPTRCSPSPPGCWPTRPSARTRCSSWGTRCTPTSPTRRRPQRSSGAGAGRHPRGGPRSPASRSTPGSTATPGATA